MKRYLLPHVQTRRTLLRHLSALGALAALPRAVVALGEMNRFTITRLKYDGDWNPRPSAAQRWLIEVSKSTSIEIQDPIDAAPDSDRIFTQPFLYWSGTKSFSPLSEKARRNLEQFIRYGGFLIIDDVQGDAGTGFDQSVRRELAAIIPEKQLERLNPEHSVFRSFFLLPPEQAIGRLASRRFVEGISFGDWTPVLYTMNDLGGALARDPFGNWELDCVPGGEQQRSWGLRFAVNIVLYALTMNYKKDQIHVEEILRRQQAL